MNKIKYILFILIVLFFSANSIYSNSEVIQAGIDEKLDEYIGKDIEFYDVDGNKKPLLDFITKPTVISMVYFNCPGICTPLLDGLQQVVGKADIVPGVDYNILSISFDHKETPELAKKWQKNYVGGLKRKIDYNSWQFLTSDSVNIRKLTNTLGFYFKVDGEKDYLHAASLIMIAPDGKITRYLFGTTFLPFDLKMATIEASKGQSRPTINKILELCFKYDPEGRTYVLNFTRIAGAVMMLVLGVFVTILLTKGRKKRQENEDV